MNPRSRYVYAICANNECEDEDTESILTIGTREDWEERHCCSDYHTEETETFLASLDIYADAEATFLIPHGRTEAVRLALSQNPNYDNDQGFQRFINRSS